MIQVFWFCFILIFIFDVLEYSTYLISGMTSILYIFSNILSLLRWISHYVHIAFCNVQYFLDIFLCLSYFLSPFCYLFTIQFSSFYGFKVKVENLFSPVCSLLRNPSKATFISVSMVLYPNLFLAFSQNFNILLILSICVLCIVQFIYLSIWHFNHRYFRFIVGYLQILEAPAFVSLNYVYCIVQYLVTFYQSRDKI